MRKERLLKFADFLDNFRLEQGEHFDIGSWLVVNDCGTSACAIGWGMKRGLFPELETYVEPSMSFTFIRLKDQPEFKTMYAVGKLFDISSDEAEWLFSDIDHDIGERETPSQVADGIRQFVSAN